ncbi:MAG TPA: hypothetical protein VJP83_01745 [Terriglobales bacterium]|nr:hypothetical protein [Terriglobales bacterium]
MSEVPTRPLVSMSIRPTTLDLESLRRALSTLAQDDPTLSVNTPCEGEQVTICGMGELHLEMVCDRLLREYNIKVEASGPNVIYLETIRKPSEAEGKFIRQTGGRGQYGHVKIKLEPQEPGKGYEFVSDSVGGSVPRAYIKPVDQGIQEAMKGGVLAGYEVVDIKATLYDGSYHEVDSSEIAFKIAGSMAFKEAARKAGPVLLEPVMSVEVVVPDEFLGDTLDGLNSRRGRVEGVKQRAGSQMIKAYAPLSQMFGYATDLRSRIQGRASFSMHFWCYEQAPIHGGDDEGGPGVTANIPWKPVPRTGAAAVPPPIKLEN